MNDAAVCAFACLYVWVFQQILWFIRAMVGTVPPEPKPGGATWRWNTTLSSHKSYMEGYSHHLWPSIPFKGQCKERLTFFFLPTCVVTVNPHGAESANISGKLRRKGRAKFFSLPPPLRPYPSLSYLSVAESQWFIIIGRCHHADDTQSAL